jgi:hypothetical protein
VYAPVPGRKQKSDEGLVQECDALCMILVQEWDALSAGNDSVATQIRQEPEAPVQKSKNWTVR